VDLTRQEAVAKRRYRGMLLAFGGVMLVILKPTASLRFSLDTLMGDVLNLLAAICAAIFFTVWPKPLLRTYSPIRIMGYCMLVGAVVLWAAFLFGGQPSRIPEFGARVWWPLLYAVVFAGILGHTFWYEGIDRLGATNTLIYLYFIPVWAALFNFFFLGEQLFPQQMAGGVLILMGVHYALREQGTAPPHAAVKPPLPGR
jgi:drug/metabolite transporter (DMT)-like permease